MRSQTEFGNERFARLFLDVSSFAMPLKVLSFSIDPAPLPPAVQAMVDEAEAQIEAYQRDHCLPDFVACDFALAYRALRAMTDAQLPSGKLFCEWGSGFGVVACLAAQLGFDAVGIEIEEDLIQHAEKLADRFGLNVRFVQGSYLPRGCSLKARLGTGASWIRKEEWDIDAAAGFAPGDFDVIFAYPWPDDADAIAELFEHVAAPGALFASYHGGTDFRVRRKVGGKKRRTIR